MKVPLSWLKDFVDIDLPLEELVHRLTLAGLEVEEVARLGFDREKIERIQGMIRGSEFKRRMPSVPKIPEALKGEV